MMEFFTGYADFLQNQYQELLTLIYDHIELTIIAVFFAVLIGIPLGILIATVDGFDKPILGFANVMQAVPSLAALGLLVPILGIGSPPAIFMVVLYSLLPIVKNTYTGIKNINPQTIEAAHGIGMTSFQVLTKVQLPLSLPVIMAGLRISAVTAVGLMTIAAYIGAGGLGNFVISGIQTNNEYLMLSGAIPACILALLMDFIMAKIEKAVTPISLSVDATQLTREKIKKLRMSQKRIIAASLVIVLVFVSAFAYSFIPQDGDIIVISSKPEVEGVIMGNIIAELLDYHTDYEIERNLGLGATDIIANAMQIGEIDIYPEYSGSYYSAIMKLAPVPGTSPEDLYEQVRIANEQAGVTYLAPYGFNNTYTLGVLPETAQKYNLSKISDLIGVSNNFILACDQEFPHRADGIPALQAVYEGLDFAGYLQFSGVFMYEALLTDEVEIMTPFATDALLKQYDIVILEDDLSAFPSYDMGTMVRTEIAEQYPDIIPILEQLEGTLTDDEMADLNAQVVIDKKTHVEVARNFLIEEGLISE